MDLESHGEAHLHDDIISSAVLRSHQSDIPEGLSGDDETEITRTGQPQTALVHMSRQD